MKMKTCKTLLGAALLLLPGLVVAQQATTVATSTRVQVAADPALQALLPPEIRRAGYISIGANPSSPPFGFYSEGGRSIEGREIDIMTAVAGKLGLEPRWHDSGGFDNLIPGLTTGRYDVVLSNMHATPTRLERVDFVSYFNTNRLGMVVRASDFKEIHTEFSQLCGQTVAAGTGTTNAYILEDHSKICVANGKPPITVPVFPDRSSGVQSVVSGRSPAFFGPFEGLRYQAQSSNGRLVVGGIFEAPANHVAIGLKKDSALTEPVRRAVNALIADGTYAGILEYWDMSHGAITESRANHAILAQ